MRHLITACLLAGFLLPSGGRAAGLHAVKPAEGWVCKKLNLTEQQSMDPTVHIQVRSSPSDKAPVAGWAPVTVAVKASNKTVNGFEEMLRPNGQHVWIPADVLVPWVAVADPTAHCVPSVMSNGTYGFAYPH